MNVMAEKEVISKIKIKSEIQSGHYIYTMNRLNHEKGWWEKWTQ